MNFFFYLRWLAQLAIPALEGCDGRLRSQHPLAKEISIKQDQHSFEVISLIGVFRMLSLRIRVRPLVSYRFRSRSRSRSRSCFEFSAKMPRSPPHSRSKAGMARSRHLESLASQFSRLSISGYGCGCATDYRNAFVKLNRRLQVWHQSQIYHELKITSGTTRDRDVDIFVCNRISSLWECL